MSVYPSWITYLPLNRDWNLVRGNNLSRLCEVKAIAIHYTAVQNQSARSVRQYFQDRVSAIDKAAQDLSPLEQGAPFVGTHFIIDDIETLALAPSPNFVFYHVGDQFHRPANKNAWNKPNPDEYIRGIHYYTIGIEHCFTSANGKFSSAVLKQSHRLVRWLMSQYGTGLRIGRHYDFSGKACPIFCAPVLKGKNDRDANTKKTVLSPEFPFESLEIQYKTFRWQKLLAYYKQKNENNIPLEWL